MEEAAYENCPDGADDHWVGGFIAGSNYQKQISDEREKLLMGVIKQSLKTVKILRYRYFNQDFGDVYLEQTDKSIVNIEQTLKQINGGV